MEKKKIAYTGPGKYVQACGIISQLPQYTMLYGRRAFLLSDRYFEKDYGAWFLKLYQENGLDCVVEIFGGENSRKEADRCCKEAERRKADCVVGFGGGKTLDCGKYIADALKLPFICVPTTASTDAPCSSLSIIYDGEADKREVLRCHSNPDLVLVDSEIIADAPVRFLKAGIGDALATYFEALANERSGGGNFAGSDCVRTRLSLAAAECCYGILKQYSRQAVADARRHKVTQPLEYVIEANILLSGIGFENAGCAGAHSISGGIGALEECKNMMHGEKVAFGTLCQVYLERHGDAVLYDLMELCVELGLPVTLDELGIKTEREKKAELIAKGSLDKFWDAEPMKITTEDITDAILTVDSLGARWKETWKKGDAE